MQFNATNAGITEGNMHVQFILCLILLSVLPLLFMLPPFKFPGCKRCTVILTDTCSALIRMSVCKARGCDGAWSAVYTSANRTLSPRQRPLISRTEMRRDSVSYQFTSTFLIPNVINLVGFKFKVVCSHQFEDALISQFVPENHDPFLRVAVGRLAHCQGQRICPGAKLKRAGAVRPHTPHTGERADDGAPTADEWSTRRRAQNNNTVKK